MPVDPLVYTYVTNEERYPDKAIILEEGGHGDWVYVILEGKVKIQKKTPKGLVNIAMLKEGAVIGEMVFIASDIGIRTARVVADGPVVVGGLDPIKLKRDFASLSSQLQDLIKVLIRRLKNASEQLASMILEQ